MARIVIVVCIVALLGAGGGFWYWTTSPQYSLEQMKDSAREHNLSKFQMYFSIDQVADEMVKDLLASPLRKTLGGEYLERILSGGMVSENTVRAEVASSLASDLKRLVETGSFDVTYEKDSNKVSMGSLDRRLGISTLSVRQVRDIKVEGNTATITMIVHNEKFNTDLEMVGELQNKDGYWQATRIVNAVACFQQLFDLEAKNAKSGSEP
ncbi:MAG: hypothetical protein K2X93_09095 [Candidatus Obscuribacterales bacterium]|nr:hypothetical protein [Candidatus Obscuribacterales bacterium]